MKTIIDLNDLMVEELRKLYHGESMLQKQLDYLYSETTDPELKEEIANYQKYLNEQMMSLKQVFNHLFTQKRGEKNRAIEVMCKESTELIHRIEDNRLKDAAILTSIQHFIHHKIATLGATCTYAKLLGLWDENAILYRELVREKIVDRKLVILAESLIDVRAAVQ